MVLLLLGEAAGTLGNNFGGGEAPAGEAAVGLVVGEEVAGHLGVADGYQQVGDVVGQGLVGLGEGVPLNLGREPARRHVVRVRIVGNDGRNERDEGKKRREQDCGEAAGLCTWTKSAAAHRHEALHLA